jgi:hypothetical protein
MRYILVKGFREPGKKLQKRRKVAREDAGLLKQLHFVLAKKVDSLKGHKRIGA